MDTFECIRTKFEVRNFDMRVVPPEIKLEILEAARLTGTGLNTQHWRFILVEGKDDLGKLAEDSTSGKWVAGANFAIIVLTNPNYNFHLIDAGRVIQCMQLAAWSREVASGLFTGYQVERLRNDFAIPHDLNTSAILGFGYPARKLVAPRKNRLPLDELVYYGRYGKTKEDSSTLDVT
jgi:nitroreductase